MLAALAGAKGHKAGSEAYHKVSLTNLHVKMYLTENKKGAETEVFSPSRFLGDLLKKKKSQQEKKSRRFY